jgi:hypothetical protein
MKSEIGLVYFFNERVGLEGALNYQTSSEVDKTKYISANANPANEKTSGNQKLAFFSIGLQIALARKAKKN